MYLDNRLPIIIGVSRCRSVGVRTWISSDIGSYEHPSLPSFIVASLSDTIGKISCTILEKTGFFLVQNGMIRRVVRDGRCHFRRRERDQHMSRCIELLVSPVSVFPYVLPSFGLQLWSSVVRPF